MCDEAELSLQSSPTSVRAGRQFVVHTLAGWGVNTDGQPGMQVEEIALVASELLTNAVRASAADTTLHIEAHRDHVVVAVRDDSRAAAVQRTAAAGDTSGRGLAIVDSLSERWGTEQDDGSGKVVWSRMAISAPSELSERCRL